MKRKIKIGILLLLVCGLGYGWYEYQKLSAVPKTRLAAGQYYPEMPPDEHHHYLQIPIDHQDPSKGTFTDFYILSPAFKPGDNVVFWLFDNQQEAVGMVAAPEDFAYFDASLGGLSYVLIGNRGVSPTLFPEVFNPDESVNYPLAIKLYSSEQQVEDIEMVRLDMVRKGLLPGDGKIMVYGGSGGGVLVQQYLAKYGGHVSRALIEVSGAPDLAEQHGATFFKPTYKSSPGLANDYFELMNRGDAEPSIAFMLFKFGLEGRTDLQDIVMKSQGSEWKLKDKYTYFKSWVKPQYNFPMVEFLMDLPCELEVKVRIYELLGAEMEKYHPSSAQELVLGYEWIKLLLDDFIKAHQQGIIQAPHMSINRASYSGELMVWSGALDQDFEIQMGSWMASSYPNSRFAVFDDAHVRNRYPEYYRGFRQAFFTRGLHSPEIEAFFNDARQLR